MRAISKVLLTLGLIAFSVGCSGSETKSNDSVTKADAERVCKKEAEARNRCHGDYDGFASADDYVSSCVDDYGVACADYDPEAFRLISDCETEEICSDTANCHNATLNQLATKHPERQDAATACFDRVSSCIDASDPEAIDSLGQRCLSYLTVNARGAAELDECVNGNCDGLSDCLVSALKCASAP